jgi:hypothetical protein
MKQHDFTQYSTPSLIVLYNDKKATLNNPVCEPIHSNIQDLLKQIKQELNRRAK